MNAEGMVLDLGWLDVVSGAEHVNSTNHMLQGIAHTSQEMRDSVYIGITSDIHNSGLSDLLLLAEQLVINEFFIIDELALNARLGTIPNDLIPFVQRRAPPESVYLAASQAVVALARDLGKSAKRSPALKQLRADMMPEGESPLWSGHDKRLHEYMAKSGSALQMVASAASTGGDTLSRVLFYLEFARHLGDVPLLGPGKRRWMQLIGEKLEASMHEVIARKFDSIVLAKVRNDVAKLFAPVQLIPPPVAELILKKAIAEGLPILQAAISVRESPEAQDYRGLLQELRGQLRRGRSGELAAQRALDGLDKIAATWAQHHSSLVGVTIKKRTMKWEKIPVIGDLLAAADMSQSEITDKILTAPPGYLSFISTWYRDQPQSHIS